MDIPDQGGGVDPASFLLAAIRAKEWQDAKLGPDVMVETLGRVLGQLEQSEEKGGYNMPKKYKGLGGKTTTSEPFLFLFIASCLLTHRLSQVLRQQQFGVFVPIISCLPF